MRLPCFTNDEKFWAIFSQSGWGCKETSSRRGRLPGLGLTLFCDSAIMFFARKRFSLVLDMDA